MNGVDTLIEPRRLPCEGRIVRRSSPFTKNPAAVNSKRICAANPLELTTLRHRMNDDLRLCE
jgi:hypothetical protein